MRQRVAPPFLAMRFVASFDVARAMTGRVPGGIADWRRNTGRVRLSISRAAEGVAALTLLQSSWRQGGGGNQTITLRRENSAVLMKQAPNPPMAEPTMRLETGSPGLDACFAERRPGAGRLRVRILLAALGAASVATILILAPRPAPDAPIPLPEPAQRRPDWVDLLRAVPDIQFAGETARERRSHAVQQHEPGGGRRDMIATTGPDGDLRLVLYRPGQEYRGAVSLHLDMARLAAQAGLAVIASGQAAALATRFGSFEASDIRLSGDQGERNCTGFRSSLERDGQRLLVVGLSCGTGAEVPERALTACRINRLEAAPGAAQELRRWLGPAPRKACDVSRSAATSTAHQGG